jgi:mannosyltransferase
VVALPGEVEHRPVRQEAPALATGDGDPWERSHLWFPVIVVTTAVLGMIRLAAKSLWHDEAYSFATARLPSASFWKALAHQESFSGLYYLVLRVWSALGTSELWLRLPSVVFGILAVCTLFALNRRLFGTRVAVIAALLLAVNPFIVRYEQEARAYSMAMFAVVLATYVFIQAVEHPSVRRWALYGVVAAIAVYAHAFAVFVIGAHLAWLLLRRRPPVSAVIGFGLCGALVAPLLVLLVASQNIERGIANPGLGSVVSAFLVLTGSSGVRSRGAAALLLAYFLVACVAVVASAASAWRRHRRRAGGFDMWPHTLILMWLAVPVLSSLALSAVRPIFLPRYLIVVLPALVTLAALGIAALPLPALRAAAIVAIVAASIPWLVAYYGEDFKNGEDWRSAVTDVIARERPGDGIVFLTRFGRRPFEYYLERFHGEADLDPLYPSLPWGAYTPVLTDEHFRSAAEESANLSARYRRVWFVLLWGRFESPHEGGLAVQTRLDRDYRIAWRGSYGRFLDVVLYVRTSARAPGE